jgi:hypothetical protein
MQWVPGAVSPGLKRPGLEADHSPLCNAEDENGGAIPSLSYTFSVIFLLAVELWGSNNSLYTIPKCDKVQVFYCLPKCVEYFLKATRALNTIVMLPVAFHRSEMLPVTLMRSMGL